MKSVTAAFLMIAAVVIGSLWYSSGLENMSNELRGINDGLQRSLETGNIAAAESEIESLKKYIDSKEQIMSIMGDHKELHEIKESIAELERFTKGGSLVDAQAKSELLSLMIEHLPENNRIKLINIL